MKESNDSFSLDIPSQEWVEERKNYIGGSDVAAILGLSTYSTPLQVWLRKNGHIPPVESTGIMEFGNVFEPIMADYFSKDTGLKVRRVNESYIHKQYPFLRANIDRQILNAEGVDGTGVLELKTTTSHRMKSLDGEYPVEWLYQIQHYLGLTGYCYAYLQIYERDTCEFYEPVLIRRGEKLIREIQNQLIQWWQDHMLEGKRPKPMNNEDVLLLYPDSKDGSVVEATPDNFQDFKRLKTIREKINEYETLKESLETRLKESLGESERMALAGRTLISWKSLETTRFNASEFRKEYPRLYTQYQKSTQTRRFTVK